MKNKILSLGTLATLTTIPVVAISCGNKNNNSKKTIVSENNSKQYKPIAVGNAWKDLSPTDLRIAKWFGIHPDTLKRLEITKRDMEGVHITGIATEFGLLDYGRNILRAHHDKNALMKKNVSMPKSWGANPAIYEDWKNSSLKDKIVLYYNPNENSYNQYDDPKNPNDYLVEWT